VDSFGTSQGRQALDPQKPAVAQQAESSEPSTQSYARSRITQQPILHPSNALFLQRSIGNWAVSQLLSQQRSAPAHSQSVHPLPAPPSSASPSLGQTSQDFSEPGDKISSVQSPQIQRNGLGEDDDTFPHDDEVATRISRAVSGRYVINVNCKLYKHDLETSEVLGQLKRGTVPSVVAALPRYMGQEWMLIKAKVVQGEEKWGYVPSAYIGEAPNKKSNDDDSDDEFAESIDDDDDDEPKEGEIENTTYEDNEIFYGKKTQRLILHGYTLMQSQNLYAAPDPSSEVLGTIAKDIIPYRVLESTNPDWLQVRTKLKKKQKADKSGYIPRAAVRHMPLQHKLLNDRPIMPTTGPEPSHILQHRFADCYLLAALSSLARRNPAFIQNELFRTDPTVASDTYKVRFHRFSPDTGSFQAEDVTVNRSLLRFVKDVRSVKKGNVLYPQDLAYGARGEWIWPAIVEKAYAAWTNTKIDFGSALEAIRALTGKQYDELSIVDESEKSTDQGEVEKRMERQRMHRDRLIQALSGPGKIVVASTLDKAPGDWHKLKEKGDKEENTSRHSEMVAGGVVFKHAYEVISADDSKIRLRNPWGKYSRVGGQIDQEGDVSELTWDEFFATFSGYRIEMPDKPSESKESAKLSSN
jgi:hypothetical protein